MKASQSQPVMSKLITILGDRSAYHKRDRLILPSSAENSQSKAAYVVKGTHSRSYV